MNFSEILSRFYSVFESIHKYITDLNLYITELEDGIYIHQSLDSVMLNEEGKQLMVLVVFTLKVRQVYFKFLLTFAVRRSLFIRSDVVISGLLSGREY